MTSTSYRNQINEAIKAQLAGKTIAGESVFVTLDRPLNPETDLPAIMVYTKTARRGDQSYGRSVIPRIVTVAIEAAVSSTELDALEKAQEFADQIETVIDGDLTLGKLVTDTTWLQTISDVTSHGAVVMGVCVIEYDIEIMTNQRPDGYFELHNDGFIVPPSDIFSTPGVDAGTFQTTPTSDSLCLDGSCEIPAWKGETE